MDCRGYLACVLGMVVSWGVLCPTETIAASGDTIVESGDFRGLIYDTGKNGIILEGGVKSSTTSSGNAVYNTEIHHPGRWHLSYCGAIKMAGWGNRVEHVYLHHTPHTVIQVGGGDSIIRYFRIEDVGHHSGDMGAIYWRKAGSSAVP